MYKVDSTLLKQQIWGSRLWSCVLVGASLLGTACSSIQDQPNTNYTEIPSEMPVDGGAELTAAASSVSASVKAQDPKSQVSANSLSNVSVAGSTRRYQAEMPKLAARPFQKQGFWMNAHYFVRSESDWNQISQMIYGRGDRAQMLSAWNSQIALEPGTVVYYNSPFRPDDSQSMKVLAEDFGIALQSYTVRPGDSLSQIASDKFSQFESWREVAALNAGQILDPNLIEVGQVLRIQPSELNTSAILNQFIAKAQEAIKAAEAPQAPATAEAAQLDQSAQIAQAGPESTAPPAPEAALAAEPKLVEVVDDSIFSKIPVTDLLFVASALALVALAALYFVKRKKTVIAGTTGEPSNLFSFNFRRKSGT